MTYSIYCRHRSIFKNAAKFPRANVTYIDADKVRKELKENPYTNYKYRCVCFNLSYFYGRML